MEEKYLKNSIVSFILIICILSMPFAFFPNTKKAEAAGISDYLGGISKVVTQMPMCKGIGSIKDLFKSSTTLKGEDLISKVRSAPLMQDVSKATQQNTAVPVDVGKDMNTAATETADSVKKSKR